MTKNIAVLTLCFSVNYNIAQSQDDFGDDFDEYVKIRYKGSKLKQFS